MNEVNCHYTQNVPQDQKNQMSSPRELTVRKKKTFSQHFKVQKEEFLSSIKCPVPLSTSDEIKICCVPVGRGKIDFAAKME